MADPNPEDAPKPGIFRAVFTGVRRLIFSVSFWAGAAVIVIAVSQIVRSPVRLTQINIVKPDASTDLNITGEQFAQALSDRVHTIAARARVETNLSLRLELGKAPDPIAVDVPGSKISVADITRLIREILGLGGREFSGSLYISNSSIPSASSTATHTGAYRLVLRDSNQDGGPLFDESGRLEVLIEDGALSILGELNPVIAANYLRSQGRAVEATRMAQKAVASGESHDRHEQARAYLMLGLTLGEESRFDEADEAFNEAIKASKNDPGVRNSASDDKGFIRLEAARKLHNPMLLKDVDRYLEGPAKSGFDSARYHQA